MALTTDRLSQGNDGHQWRLCSFACRPDASLGPFRPWFRDGRRAPSSTSGDRRGLDFTRPARSKRCSTEELTTAARSAYVRLQPLGWGGIGSPEQLPRLPPPPAAPPRRDLVARLTEGTP